jgi:pimeloyl-ACP methyl ester carboxylesterase
VSDQPATPLDQLEALAVQEQEIDPGLTQIEIYTMSGLLSLWWHGPRDAERVVLACGGAMGGTLGPGRLFHRLGRTLTQEGIGMIRVDYRVPNDLPSCTHDAAAAADWAARSGARRMVAMGHSFGGAVAIRLAVALGEHCAGVITVATQSAGCEPADQLGETPLLLIHGSRDELLPVQASEMVRLLADHGELDVIDGAGHLFDDHDDELEARVRSWLSAVWD